MTAPVRTERLDFDTPTLKRHRRWRAMKDHSARWYVTIGGLAVLAAITLIFFYLGSVVAPMFQGASIEPVREDRPAWMADAAPAQLLVIEEQNEVALRLDAQGHARFFALADGKLLKDIALPLPEGAKIVSLAEDVPGSKRFVLGLDNGQALVVEQEYRVSYPNNVKTIDPLLHYPLGEQPVTLDAEQKPLEHVGVSQNGSTWLLASSSGAELDVLRISQTRNLMTGESSLDETRLQLPQLAQPIRSIVIDPRHLWLYALSGDASVDVFDVRRQQLNGRYKLLKNNAKVTAVAPLLGGISLMIGDSQGGIGQWFMVRNEDGSADLQAIRQFQLSDGPIT